MTPILDLELPTSGIIQLLGYEHLMDETWEISADCETVHIISTMFNLEEGYDFLYITSSSTSNYTGNESISSILPGIFTVRFESDYSVTSDGFVLEWKCINR